MSNTIELFTRLESLYRHPMRGRMISDELERSKIRFNYQRSQIELYHLAQAIAPSLVQLRIDLLRRDVVGILKEESERLGRSSVIKPHFLHRPIRWCEYILTPELESDLALGFKLIPYKLARELLNTHKTQIHEVRRIVGL